MNFLDILWRAVGTATKAQTEKVEQVEAAIAKLREDRARAVDARDAAVTTYMQTVGQGGAAKADANLSTAGERIAELDLKLSAASAALELARAANRHASAEAIAVAKGRLIAALAPQVRQCADKAGELAALLADVGAQVEAVSVILWDSRVVAEYLCPFELAARLAVAERALRESLLAPWASILGEH